MIFHDNLESPGALVFTGLEGRSLESNLWSEPTSESPTPDTVSLMFINDSDRLTFATCVSYDRALMWTLFFSPTLRPGSGKNCFIEWVYRVGVRDGFFESLMDKVARAVKSVRVWLEHLWICYKIIHNFFMTWFFMFAYCFEKIVESKKKKIFKDFQFKIIKNTLPVEYVYV